MHISNDRYFRDRKRHDLALRMIRHEARTCTIKSCTGLTDDRIRRLYKTLAEHQSARVHRRRGKSPRQIAFFTRNARVQFESSILAGVFIAFGLMRQEQDRAREIPSIEFGELFCDAYETHMQLLNRAGVSFEHAWFLLQLLNRHNELKMTRCRRCHGHYLRDLINVTARSCPVCELKNVPARRPASRQRVLSTVPAELPRSGEPCIAESPPFCS